MAFAASPFGAAIVAYVVGWTSTTAALLVAVVLIVATVLVVIHVDCCHVGVVVVWCLWLLLWLLLDRVGPGAELIPNCNF